MASEQVQVKLDQAQKATVVSLNNKTPTDMKLDYVISVSGSFTSDGAYRAILANSDVSFVHLKGDGGSRALMRYTGVDNKNVAYTMIIYWDAPPDNTSTSANKVIVLGGPKSVVGPIDWSTCNVLMSNASSFAWTYGVEATISHQPADTALLIANFQFA